MPADISNAADRIVRQDVHLCLSSMVTTLARDAATTMHGDLANLTEQAADLAAPVLDFVEAARQAGWRDDPLKPGRLMRDQPNHLPSVFNYADTAEEACEIDSLDPYEWEVYEHWAVSTWLAEQLQSQGEKVDTDFAGLNVWARTTTGQSISMDAVIQRIATDVASAV